MFYSHLKCMMKNLMQLLQRCHLTPTPNVWTDVYDIKYTHVTRVQYRLQLIVWSALLYKYVVRQQSYLC